VFDPSSFFVLILNLASAYPKTESCSGLSHLTPLQLLSLNNHKRVTNANTLFLNIFSLGTFFTQTSIFSVCPGLIVTGLRGVRLATFSSVLKLLGYVALRSLPVLYCSSISTTFVQFSLITLILWKPIVCGLLVLFVTFAITQRGLSGAGSLGHVFKVSISSTNSPRYSMHFLLQP
jgi:hypothetical protein